MESRELPDQPLELFQRWFGQAQSMAQPMPEAMTLATANGEGQPAARMVLLKGADAKGFTFFTNYQSAKSDDLGENPKAALVFWWETIRKQVRVRGTVEKVSEEESDRYFSSRNRKSQLGAWSSTQSQVIADRGFLDDRFASFSVKFQDKDVPRPAFWGGFRVIPQTIEFWSECPHRLHDRFRYRRTSDGWRLERLSP